MDKLDLDNLRSMRERCAGETARGFAEIDAQKKFLLMIDTCLKFETACNYLQDIANMAEPGKKMPGCETAAHALAQMGIPRERDPVRNEVVVDYWHKFYCTEHCSLCGNSGIIDSRGKRTAAGVSAGRRNWCICPNGQEARHFAKGSLPSQIDVMDWVGDPGVVG